MTKRSKRGGKGGVQDVRVLDMYSGKDGAKVDRQIQSLLVSESQVRCLVSGTFAIDVPTGAAVSTIYGWTQIRALDEFVSLAAQYNNYRVNSIRFDIYDVNPARFGTGFFSTFHDAFNTGGVPVYSFENVVDGPDSQIVPPGTGKVSFTWRGHTTNERGFYDVAPDNDAGAVDFGGLRAFVFNETTGGSKFRLVIKAVVDFRGRR